MFRSWSREKLAAVPSEEVTVRVSGGYQPDVVVVAAGEPARITFRREETSPCSEQVVFPAFGLSAMLPTGKDVVVELPPAPPGEYGFNCAMDMLHGRVVVRERAAVSA